MTDGCCDTGSKCDCNNIPDHKMCRLAQPPGKFNLEKVKELASDPKFICKCCGRMANDQENLCSPVELG